MGSMGPIWANIRLEKLPFPMTMTDYAQSGSKFRA